MFVRWLLFETKIGETFLVFLEKKAGLAVVEESWLADYRIGRSKASPRTQ